MSKGWILSGSFRADEMWNGTFFAERYDTKEEAEKMMRIYKANPNAYWNVQVNKEPGADMVLTVHSRLTTGPTELNSKNLTREQWDLLTRLFEMGGIRDPWSDDSLFRQGTITLSFDMDRTKTMDEMRKEEEEKIERLMKEAKK